MEFLMTGILLATPQQKRAATATAPATGTYSITIDTLEVDHTGERVQANAVVQCKVPAGNGFLVVPLPFSLESAKSVFVSPDSGYGFIARGDLRPDGEFSSLLVQMQDHESKVRILVQGVGLKLVRSAEPTRSQYVQLLVHKAASDAQELMPGTILLPLGSILIRSDLVSDTEPHSSLSGHAPEMHLIDFSELKIAPSDITVFLKSESSLRLLYFLLAGAGIVLGIFTTPKLARGRLSARVTLGCSVVGLMILALIFWEFLPSDQRTYDTTTIVTCATITGSLIGLILASLRTVIKIAIADRASTVRSAA